MISRHLTLTLALTILLCVPQTNASEDTTQIRLGYFEGGKYPLHDYLRQELNEQLKAVMPDSLSVIFGPEGFRSAA